MARVFDCFPFYNELDLLELRLHELADVVDRFIIAEADMTFAGHPKPLNFADHAARFAAFKDRIDYIVVRDMPKDAPTGWVRQWHQREAMCAAIESAAPDDVILLSDSDEIVKAPSLRDFCARNPNAAEIGCFELRHYNYYLNWECDQRWLRSGPRAVRKKYFRDFTSLRRVRGPSRKPLQDLARSFDAARLMRRPVKRVLLPDAGWHFTYLGGAQALIDKDRNFRGSEKPLFGDDAEAEAARWIAEGLAVKIDGAPLVQPRALDDTFPAYLREHRERFESLIGPLNLKTVQN